MKNTHRLTLISILTALYVVLSAFMRIPLIGNIKLDLGYVVFAIALIRLDLSGTIWVGCLSVAIESLLFGVHGFSVAWTIANFFIALLAKNNKNYFVGCLIGCVIGLVGAKTIIEWFIFKTAISIKLANNAVACLADYLCLVIGYFVDKKLPKSI